MVNAPKSKESHLPEWLIQGVIVWKIQLTQFEKSRTDADACLDRLSTLPFNIVSKATPSIDSSHILWRTLLKYIQEVIKHFLMSQERTEVRKTPVQMTVV